MKQKLTREEYEKYIWDDFGQLELDEGWRYSPFVMWFKKHAKTQEYINEMYNNGVSLEDACDKIENFYDWFADNYEDEFDKEQESKK